MKQELNVTELGIVVARSGLLPETASYFIDFLSRRGGLLLGLLPSVGSLSEIAKNNIDDEALQIAERELSFVLSHLIFCSPEYRDTATPAQRFIPFMLADLKREPTNISRISEVLVEPWDHDVGAVNATEVVLDFSDGAPLVELESRFEGLSSGIIHMLLRDHVAHLKGLADIIDTLSNDDFRDINTLVPKLVESVEQRILYRRVVGHIRVRIRQLVNGVPEDLFWMRELKQENGGHLMSRSMVMSLAKHGLQSLDDILDTGKTDLFHKAMTEAGVNNSKRDEIRKKVGGQRIARTQAIEAKLKSQLPDCGNIVGRVFNSRNLEFEDSLADCFECLGLTILERDRADGPSGFPDFLVKIDGAESDQPLVLECKSKASHGEVDLTAAAHVGTKATIHGLNDHSLVTVCHPYVSTDVPRKLKKAANLSVVNFEDLAIAMAALKTEKITPSRFKSWLTTPGQPRVDDLFG